VEVREDEEICPASFFDERLLVAETRRREIKRNIGNSFLKAEI
jgi:hypothetical protein